MNPIVPVLILLLGAASVIPRFTHPLRTGFVTAGTLLLAIVTTLMMGFRLPSRATISQWGPEALFPSMGLSLVADKTSWLLATVLLVVVMVVILCGIASHNSSIKVLERVAALLITATSLGAIFAESLVALSIGWTGIAACRILTFVAVTRERGYQDDRCEYIPRAVVGLGVDVLASMLVLAAALHAIGGGNSDLLTNRDLPSQSVLYLFLAVGMRLNLYPFYRALGVEWGLPQGLRLILSLATFATAVDALVVVSVQKVPIPLQGWLSASVMVAGLLGAWLWWSYADRRQGITYFFLAQSSLIGLMVLWGGAFSAVGVVSQGMAVLLGGSVLFLYHGFVEEQRVWIVAPLLAVGMIVGIPLTVGYLGMWTLYSVLLQTDGWIAIAAVVLLVQALLVAGALRRALCSRDIQSLDEPLAKIMQWWGLAAPLALGVVLGLAPGALMRFVVDAPTPSFAEMIQASHGLGVLGATVLACGLGVALWNLSKGEQSLTLPGPAARLVPQLDGLYSGLRISWRFAGRILRTAGTILEGEGGVLWALVIAFMIWLGIDG